MPEGSCARQKISDRLHHAVNLASSQLCVYGNTENFIGKLVSHLAIAAAEIFRVGKTFLLIHGDRIIDLAADVMSEQMRLQGIALSCAKNADRILIPDGKVVLI